MNRKHLTGQCPSCCSSELLWMCPWQIDFSLCLGSVCDTGAQRNNCSTTVFSVQGMLCTGCLWVQHLGNLAKAACLAHYSPGYSSWKWHPTCQQCWDCSFGTQAPQLRTADPSLTQPRWRIPNPMALAEALSCWDPGSSSLSQEGLHHTEMEASYPTSFSLPYMPGKDWAALCQCYRSTVTMNGLNIWGISPLNTKIIGF